MDARRSALYMARAVTRRLEVVKRVQDRHAASALLARDANQHLVPMFGNVDGDEQGRRNRMIVGHNRSPWQCGSAKPLLRPETGYGHARSPQIALRVAITSKQRFFPTCYGKEVTDRLFGLRKRGETGEHGFDKLCAALGIEHRLTSPKSPQTNGMIERVNGRIEEVLQSHHFRSGEEPETTLHRYLWLYNQQLPPISPGQQDALGGDKRMAQSQAISVQETAMLPAGM